MLIGTPNHAFLLITCNEGKLEEVFTDMQQLNEVKEIQETIGAYDIIVKIESETWENLDHLLFEKIRTIPDIGNVVILHCDKKWE